MKNLIKLEEVAQFGACALALYILGVPWWVFPILLLGPDVSMLGYLVNTQVGAISYNLFHHKGIALLALCSGAYAAQDEFLLVFAGLQQLHDLPLLLIGLILYGHASMDRVFGYGLKFGDSFQHTHLGWIGKLKGQEQGQGAGNAPS